MFPKHEPYKRFDEHVHFFVQPELKRLQAELAKITGKENPDVWEAARQFDGTTEYIAFDVIEYQVYAHLQMQGNFYLMYEENMSVPTQFRELSWKLGDGTMSRNVSSMNFQKYVPRIFYSTDEALAVLGLRSRGTPLTMTRNSDGTLFDLWTVQVNGHAAYGNGLAEAIVHAWGISQGIWKADDIQ